MEGKDTSISVGKETDVGPAMAAMEDTMEDILEAASVQRVFGEPIKNNGTVIIPVAGVMTGLGFGGGFGTAMKSMKMRRGLAGKAQKMASGQREAEAEPSMPEEGGGMGGGGRVSAWPVAVVVASGDRVQVQPVIDNTKIAMTAIISGALFAFLIIRSFARR